MVRSGIHQDLSIEEDMMDAGIQQDLSTGENTHKLHHEPKYKYFGDATCYRCLERTWWKM